MTSKLHMKDCVDDWGLAVQSMSQDMSDEWGMGMNGD